MKTDHCTTHSRPAMFRAGFTLIELMVTIGIMIVLLGLLFVGGSAMIASGKSKQTRVDMENFKSMIAELEQTGTLDKQLTSTFPPKFPMATGTDVLFSDRIVELPVVGPQYPSSYPSTERYQQGPLITDGATGRQGQAVVDTMRVLRRVQANPKNKAAISALSADKRMRIVLPNTTALPTPVATESDLFALLDAWDNPVIFVPPGGLFGVFVAGATAPSDAKVVTSNGIYSATATGAVPPAQRRWFLASGGPDGNLATGDDNVYSFEN